MPENETLNNAPTVVRTRTPRSYADILRGALSLELSDRVNLVKELKASIQTEVDEARVKAERAVKESEGL